MALTQKLDNINWSLIFERLKTVEKERRRGEEEEEEEEEKKKRREEEGKNKKVWNYEFLYRILKFCMNFHAIVWLVAYPKLRVC